MRLNGDPFIPRLLHDLSMLPADNVLGSQKSFSSPPASLLQPTAALGWVRPGLSAVRWGIGVGSWHRREGRSGQEVGRQPASSW